MKFSVFQLSRQGGRDNNEDRMGYCHTREAGLFVLADGLGGHSEGEVAAQIALHTLSALFQNEAKPRLGQPSSFLSSGLLAAHRQIIRYASERAVIDTPHTTLVACVVQEGKLHWVHCGDSRLYVVRDGALLLRTRDHSFVEARLHAGVSIGGANRNELFSCLGSTVRPVFDVAGPLELNEGDRVLLCSDGLWNSVDEAEIVDVLSNLPVAEAVPTLVDHALSVAGARSDNVTALALEWEAPAGNASEAGGFTETQTMNSGEFASTIRANVVAPVPEELDEVAIERSIAEIKDAIHRAGALIVEREAPAENAFKASGFSEIQAMNASVFAATVQADITDPVSEELDEVAIERSIAEINDAIHRTARRR
jgi:serine/threonine protein phosphatase PrpC